MIKSVVLFLIESVIKTTHFFETTNTHFWQQQCAVEIFIYKEGLSFAAGAFICVIDSEIMIKADE